MSEKVRAILPKTAVRAVKAQEFWQLCAGEEKSDAALESGHDALGNKIDDRACLHQPCEKSDQRDQQRSPRGQRAKTRRVAASNPA